MEGHLFIVFQIFFSARVGIHQECGDTTEDVRESSGRQTRLMYIRRGQEGREGTTRSSVTSKESETREKSEKHVSLFVYKQPTTTRVEVRAAVSGETQREWTNPPCPTQHNPHEPWSHRGRYTSDSRPVGLVFEAVKLTTL